MLRTIFSFQGRVARLPYLGYSLLVGLLACLIIVIVSIIAAITSSHDPLGPLVMLIVVGLMVGVMTIWAGFALIIKRLHDLGLSGLHLIVIVLMGLSATALQDVAPTISILLSVVTLGVHLFLIFAPGQPGQNRFGPAPTGVRTAFPA